MAKTDKAGERAALRSGRLGFFLSSGARAGTSFRAVARAQMLRLIWMVSTALLLAMPVHAADPVTDARAMLARLSPDGATHEYVAVAREFGQVVDSVRQGNGSDAVLLDLRKIADDMRTRAEARLRAAEAEAGDDEGALEQIYESATWDDLSFAMSAFPYWRSWLDLTLAERPSQLAKRDKRLWQAKRGFRAASMQIFQPNLVYGGWLGMGYIAEAEKQNSRAIQIFEALKKALAAEPKHPVYEMADAEIRLLKGEAPPPGMVAQAAAAGGGLDTETATLYAEAMRLLAQHRAGEAKRRGDGVGAREAAEKLRTIIRNGKLTMEILTDALGYQAELAREGLDQYTDLLLAEFNFNNQQWYTAIQKYRSFFQNPPQTPGIRYDRFRYRYAVALLKSDLNEDAAREAERLLKGDTEPAVKQAATKLAYIARAGNAEVNINAASRSALASAAKRFIEQSPGDPDADGARLLLAQSSGESGAALKYLNSVQSSGKFAGGIERTRFYVIAKDFAEAARTGTGLEAAARQAMSAWETLPAEEKKSAQNQAFFFQLLAVTDPKPAGLLPRLEVAEQKTATAGLNVKRAYLWSRLKIYERMGEPQRLLADINARGTEAAQSWVLEQYFPFVRRQALTLRLQLVEAMIPMMEKQPEMERRFKLMYIDDLLASDQGEKAYETARAFIKEFPRAGDGYRALAKTAQQTKRLVEADNAWRVITEKVPPKEPVWWEGMLSRIEIRASSTRPATACELVETVSKRLPAPKTEFANRFAALRKKVSCPAS
jgi:hypothetical protein